MKQQLPDFLKFAMYCSEIVVVNVIFYIFFKDLLSPGSTSISDVSALYGWLSMTLTMSYVVGVWLRPISFFYRSRSRSGSIVLNVTISTFYMAFIFLSFLVLMQRVDIFVGHHGHMTLVRVLTMCVSIAFSLILLRVLARTLIRTLRSSGRNVHRVVFVGGNDNILELYDEMCNPFYGYKVLGYFADERRADAPANLVYLGMVKDALPYMDENDVQQLYCCLPSAFAADIRPIVNYCENHCVRFFSVPNVRNYLKRTMQFEMLGSVPVLYIREDPFMSLTNRFIKRTFDIIVSGLFMIPFWLVIYPIIGILTKILQPGPVFFKQKRNGINGKVFFCYKFRSMKVNADADRLQATADDPRKTPFGNFLRKSSLDELPQFINVLRGDMSIVGPRPHMLKHTEEYSALIDKYMVRHWVRPGITGWAQVTGARGETKELWQMEDRIKKDIWYVENWSLWLDIKIMFMTVWNAVAGDKQAY